jgi:hypothetical protein
VTLDRSAKKRFGGISPPEHFNASQPASCNLVVAPEWGGSPRPPRGSRAQPRALMKRSCRMNARYFNLELLQLLTHNKIVMVDQPSAVQDKARPGPKNLGKVVRLTLMVLHDGKSASCAA